MNKPIRRFCIALMLALLASQTGCDPVRTTSQTVRIEILDAENGTPISGLQVRLKSGFGLWFSASTNSQGLAEISVESTMIDRSRSATPSRNLIHGITPFDFELVASDGDAELCSMIIEAGSSKICNDYKIVIKSIDAAVYIPTN